MLVTVNSCEVPCVQTSGNEEAKTGKRFCRENSDSKSFKGVFAVVLVVFSCTELAFCDKVRAYPSILFFVICIKLTYLHMLSNFIL